MKGTQSAIAKLILLVGLCSHCATATTIKVPGDQPTIQAGINAAANGDTVLVSPGEYLTGINFSGKGIVVGSRFLLSGDTTYISETIIRANSSVRVVTFASGEDSTAILVGFTVTSGLNGIYCQNSLPILRHLIVKNNISNQYGGGLLFSNSNPTVEHTRVMNNSAQFHGGGVFCSNSNATLTDVVIVNNTSASDGAGVYCYNNSTCRIENALIANNTASWYGGGIACRSSSPSLNNVIIQENTAWRYYGGGLHCETSSPTLRGVLITRNKVNRSVGVGTGGGGISCVQNSNPNLANVTISRNSAKVGGGGIYIDNSSTVTLDTMDRCNIYLNDATVGYDIHSGAVLHVAADTFTVMNPRNEHTYPIANFTFDILHAKASQNQSTLYVSPEGDNGNSGLSWAEPLRTIGFAKSIINTTSQVPATVYLAPGTYSYETNGEHFGLSWRRWLSKK